ncbi:MAG: MFS transporter [Solirubrobacteraceae bacterium]
MPKTAVVGSSRPAAQAARAVWAGSRGAGRLARGKFVRRVGGPARARVIAAFAAVLALNGADTSTVSAISPQLESALHIGPTQIGLLISVGLLVGAVFTLPVGTLVDRRRRIPILAVSIVLWSLASLAGALAGSYSALLLSRLALGAVAATAGPAIASLTGDYFPASERGRIYGYILGGEVAGAAVGYIVSGSAASLIDWRAAFVVLAIPGFFLARVLWRTVPEPLRGGQSHLQPGEVDLEAAVAAAAARADDARGEPEEDTAASGHQRETAQEAARRAGAVANPRLVLRQDPRTMSLIGAVRYSLRVPSNLMMIIGTSLGYFYYQGLSAFALLFVRGHYHASQATSELVLVVLVIAAVGGTLLSGRLTDRMLARGMLKARVLVPAVCYVLAALLLVPGFISSSLTPALWFDVVGVALISAANPPIQAARLDIMPAALWGRATSGQTAIRSLAQALAPTLFGVMTSIVAGFVPRQAPIGTHPGRPSPATATGLEVTFLIMLATLVAAGIFMARARVTYASDVATAAASEQEVAQSTGSEGDGA